MRDHLDAFAGVYDFGYVFTLHHRELDKSRVVAEACLPCDVPAPAGAFDCLFGDTNTTACFGRIHSSPIVKSIGDDIVFYSGSGFAGAMCKMVVPKALCKSLFASAEWKEHAQKWRHEILVEE